jgi:type IX secretion system PorP/SprF family membrane protein
MKKTSAQVDPHFSQFYANPLWLNPGMTGMMDGSIRMTAIYRNQWNNVMTPFITTGFSIDANTNKNLNIGASFLNQTAGTAGYRYTTGGISIAYSGVKFGMDESQHIIVGLQGGVLGRYFDPAKFQFGDQWNPVTGFDPTSPSADQLAYTAVSVFDAGAGIAYMDAGNGKTARVFGGVSAFHLTRPRDPFVNTGLKQKMPLRLSVHSGVRLQVSNNISIIPNFLFMKQGAASEKMGGIYGGLAVNSDLEVMLGCNYRFGDAVSPFAGLAFRGLIVGVSYDANISDLGKAVAGTNSMEISVSWISRKKSKALQYLTCPRF